jgi:adenosylcobinamide kinase/adenosylcobinamide-phosphate guanylyltransferase
MATIKVSDMKYHQGRLVSPPGTLVSATHGARLDGVGSLRAGVHMKPRVTLVIGGGRSGKSRFAQSLAESCCASASCRAYIATAEPIDDEMKARIAAHRADRSDRFVTVEEPLDLAGALTHLGDDIAVALVDCLTVWLGNLIFHQGAREDRYEQERELLKLLADPPCEVILVSNETGMGFIPADAESRAFRDHAGWLNQDVAALSDTVVLMVAGIPVVLKGARPAVASEGRR